MSESVESVVTRGHSPEGRFHIRFLLLEPVKGIHIGAAQVEAARIAMQLGTVVRFFFNDKLYEVNPSEMVLKGIKELSPDHAKDHSDS